MPDSRIPPAPPAQNGITTDRTDPALHQTKENGQNEKYLVLSEKEREKEFTQPLRLTYRHVLCENESTMTSAIAETYARDPKFYGATFCCRCGKHLPLRDAGETPAFVWVQDGTPVGS